tara:strand:- start:4219 stop:4635 length:417 start_codon:yes stop_codon:yes gene_type:complete
VIYRAVVESFGPSDRFEQSGYVFFVANNDHQAHRRLDAACALWCDERPYDAYNLKSEHELMRDCTDQAFEDAHLLEAGCRGQKTNFSYPGHDDDQLGLFLPPKELERLEAAFAQAKAYDRDWAQYTENVEGQRHGLQK